jgi:cell division protein FtsX
LAGVAEFWFLNGLTASGVALKRPKAARAVGAVGFVFFLVAAAATLGWKVYYEQFRPKPPNEDWLLYEQAGVMIGWLLMIGVYWRAVSHVRGAIREFLDAADQS